MPSIYTTGQNTLVTLAQTLSEATLNWPVKPLASPGATDASNFLRHQNEDFPFIMFGPGETTVAHKINEYVNRQTYLDFIDLYEDLFVQYLNTLH
jgi:Acetylornithine deacetylase/Succinyl-diaminopimelate desuccinylase and related deacylases